MQALLSVHQYYIDGSPAEQALAARIDKLWREVDWNFYRQNGQNVLYWHWSPEYGWEMNFPVHGYNECLIMYIPCRRLAYPRRACSSLSRGLGAERGHCRPS